MLCYKDMTFCSFHQECSKGKDCHRALTDKVKKDAYEWSNNIGIAQFVDKPECFKED